MRLHTATLLTLLALVKASEPIDPALRALPGFITLGESVNDVQSFMAMTNAHPREQWGLLLKSSPLFVRPITDLIDTIRNCVDMDVKNRMLQVVLDPNNLILDGDEWRHRFLAMFYKAGDVSAHKEWLKNEEAVVQAPDGQYSLTFSTDWLKHKSIVFEIDNKHLYEDLENGTVKNGFKPSDLKELHDYIIGHDSANYVQWSGLGHEFLILRIRELLNGKKTKLLEFLTNLPVELDLNLDGFDLVNSLRDFKKPGASPKYFQDMKAKHSKILEFLAKKAKRTFSEFELVCLSIYDLWDVVHHLIHQGFVVAQPKDIIIVASRYGHLETLKTISIEDEQIWARIAGVASRSDRANIIEWLIDIDKFQLRARPEDIFKERT